MSPKDVSKQGSCPVTYALEIFGDRWTLVVLRNIVLESRYRNKELCEAIPRIATNVLADRLKRLESRGLVIRERDPEDARQFLYKPTPLAVSVIPMLVEMIAWGAQYGDGEVSPTFLRRLKEDREGVIEELQKQARERASIA